MEEALRKQREAANFKAHPAKVLAAEPFVPAKSTKPLAEVSNFQLHSDKRAIEREQFTMQQKQKEAELESMKRQVRNLSKCQNGRGFKFGFFF